jgi:riboflavin synthase
VFTGIITATGTFQQVDQLPNGRRFRISAPPNFHPLVQGESIAVSGVCLTVETFGGTADQENWFSCTAGHETLKKTTLGSYKVGDEGHLERALRLSDRLGGHLVTGHVDTVGTLVKRTEQGTGTDIRVRIPVVLMPFVVEKGSVTLDGASLTVTSVDRDSFGVMLVPHTLKVTRFSDAQVGAQLNVETDLIGKYVARMLGTAGASSVDNSKLMDLLAQLPAGHSSD